MSTSTPTVGMAAHVLYTSELAEMIAKCLYDNDDGGGRQSLARLARTSRLIMESTLPILWQVCPDLRHLLRLFPDDVWVETLDEYGRHAFSFTDTSHLDWTRFDIYAGYIREFAWGGAYDIPLSTLSDLHKNRANGALFPRLRKLTIFVEYAELFPIMSAFLTPTLVTLNLELYLNEWSEGQACFLRSVRETCTDLQALYIEMDMHYQEGAFLGGDAFTDCLSGLRTIRLFYAGERPHSASSLTSAQCFHALAELPRLADVSLRPFKRSEKAAIRKILDASSSLQPGGTRHWFPALRRFFWEVEEMNDITVRILDSIRSDELEALNIWTSSQPSMDDLRKHLEAIARRPSRADTLKALDISFTHIDAEDTSRNRYSEYVPPEIDLSDALHHLLPFRQLTHLHIAMRSLRVDERTAEKVAARWPALRYLRLLSETPLASPASKQYAPRLRTVLKLAEMCPRMEDFRLEVYIYPTEDVLPPDAEIAGILQRRVPALAALSPTDLDALWAADAASRAAPEGESYTPSDPVEAVLEPLLCKLFYLPARPVKSSVSLRDRDDTARRYQVRIYYVDKTVSHEDLY